jgi:outer membrane protein
MKAIKSVLLSCMIAIAVLAAYHLLFKPETAKLGFVRTPVLLQQYKGMEAATQQFKQEMSVAQANADTLRLRYERLAAKAQTEPGNTDLGYQVATAEKEFIEYSQRAEAQMAEREQKLSSDATSKINAEVEAYGKANGYKMILGANGSGSLMYGDAGDDLTDIILQRLNQAYDLNNNQPQP